MGLFNAIKQFLSFRKEMKDSVEQFKRNMERYPKLTTDELKKLSEGELFDAVLTRTENKVDDYGETYEEMTAGINALSEKQRVFYCVYYLDSEVNNGGLCQFFVNSSRAAAPFVSECLGALGAAEHKNLFDGFIQKYNINVNDLSSFDSDDLDTFSAQYDRFPFDEYDDAFYSLKPLTEYLREFIKQNIEEF